MSCPTAIQLPKENSRQSSGQPLTLQHVKLMETEFPIIAGPYKIKKNWLNPIKRYKSILIKQKILSGWWLGHPSEKYESQLG